MFTEAKDDGGGGDNWSTGAISRAKLQSNHHHQQTNNQFFTGWMPFLSPNQQCQSTEGKISHSMDLLTPSSSGSGGLQTLSLTTDSSWLPWGRVAMPLISPLMPVPHILNGNLYFFSLNISSWVHEKTLQKSQIPCDVVNSESGVLDVTELSPSSAHQLKSV